MQYGAELIIRTFCVVCWLTTEGVRIIGPVMSTCDYNCLDHHVEKEMCIEYDIGHSGQWCKRMETGAYCGVHLKR